MHLRVQTVKPMQKRSSDDNDNKEEEEEEQVTAVAALREACNTLSSTCDIMLDELERVLPQEINEDKLQLQRVLDQEENYLDDDDKGDENFMEEEEEEEDEGFAEDYMDE